MHDKVVNMSYIAISSEEVWYELLIDVVHESARALVVFASIDEKLFPGVLIDERTDQRPEHREYSWCPHDEEEAHGLRIVGFHYFYDSEECPDAWPPEVAHAQSLQVYDTRTVPASRYKESYCTPTHDSKQWFNLY